MKRILFFLITLLPICISAQDTFLKTLEHDGLEREYLIYVPEIYDGTIAVPLMLVYHGFGGQAKDMMEFIADFRPLADTANFIVVYPQGSINEGEPHWNIEGPDSKSDADDLGFTEAMLDAIHSEYSIDRERIYACGYSNGGFFSLDLACRLSHRIAAVGSVAGTMLQDSYINCNPTHPTAVITINGTSDQVVAYDGFPPFTYSLDAVNEYWATSNLTQSSPEIIQMPDLNTADGSNVEYFSWQEGEGCVSVDHYKVINGGHDWPDKKADPFKNNVDISATELIWQFVSQYNMEGKIDCEPSLSEEVSNDKLNIFPNPASNILHIESQSAIANPITIYDGVGRMIRQITSTDNRTRINVSNLSEGLYWIKIGGEVFNVTITP